MGARRGARSSWARARAGLVALTVLAGVAGVSPSRAQTPVVGGNTIFIGEAFDRCNAPTLAQLDAWKSDPKMPYGAIGVYIGGRNATCKNLTPEWVAAALGRGWRLIPIFVGLQAPCSRRSDLAKIDPAKAAAQGTSEAQATLARAEFFGLGAGTPLYYDMEAYPRGGTCSQNVLTFMNAWTVEVHRQGYRSGFYSSAASGIADMASKYEDPSYNKPDLIWIAHYPGSPGVFGDPFVPDRYWPNHQRLHQWQGSHNETYGGVTLTIDSNYVDAEVVGAGAAMERVAGTDRYSTATAVSKSFVPSVVDTAIVATGRNFPDAVAAAGLAGLRGATILLTDPDALPAATSTELTRLKVSTIFIMGGTAAVSPAVEAALQGKVQPGGEGVVRLHGPDRFSTAAEAAKRFTPETVGRMGGKRTAFVATGENFPDALAVGPLAWRGRFPVLLVSRDEVPAPTAAVLASLQIEQVVIAGGTGAVGQSVADSLAQNYAVSRFGGASRYDTAAALADVAVDHLGFEARAALLAHGGDFPDALAAGPYGGTLGAPVLLMAGLPTATRNWLRARNDNVGTLVAVGGTGVISQDSLTKAAQAAAPPAPRSNEVYSVSPPNDARVATGDTRQFTANVPSGTAVSIRLFPAADVVESRSGLLWFRDADADNLADANASAARIVSINGATITPAQQVDDITSSGSIPFTIQSATATSVIAVVWQDGLGGADDNRLALAVPGTANPGPKAPAEAFGADGVTTFAPADAAAGSYPAMMVSNVDRAGDFFSAEAAAMSSFRYDLGDRFRDNGTVITMTQFEATLRPGDMVDITYAPTGSSVFNLRSRGTA